MLTHLAIRVMAYIPTGLAHLFMARFAVSDIWGFAVFLLGRGTIYAHLRLQHDQRAATTTMSLSDKRNTEHGIRMRRRAHAHIRDRTGEILKFVGPEGGGSLQGL